MVYPPAAMLQTPVSHTASVGAIQTACSFFGDCCQFVGNCSLNTEPANSLDWQCRSTGGITEQISIGDNIITGLPHVLMVAMCNPQWLLSQPLTFATEVQQQCEDPDIVPASPVTSQASGITYANVYCAQCNSERFVDLVFWLQQYACPTANITYNVLAFCRTADQFYASCGKTLHP